MNFLNKTTASVAIALTALGGGAALAPTLAGAQASETQIEIPAEADQDSDRSHSRADRRSERQERRAERSAAVAEALGVTVDELHADRHAGLSIADIAAANGISIDEIVTMLVEAKTASIEDKLAAGTIDPDRAADKLEDLEARVTDKVNSTDVGRRGHRHRASVGSATT